MHPLEPLSTEDSVALFLARAQRDAAAASCSMTTRPRSSRRCVGRSTACRWRSSSPPPGCGRCRCATSRDASTTGSPCSRTRAVTDRNAGARWRARSAWSYDLLFPDDQRGLWALSCFAGSASLAAVEHVLVALEVPPGAVVDTDRPGWSTARWSAWTHRRRARCATGCWTASAPTPPIGCADAGLRRDGAVAHTPAGTRRRPPGARPTCAAERQPECLAIARAERANVDAALAWCRTQRPDARVSIADRVRLDLGRPRRRHGRRRPDPRHAHVGRRHRLRGPAPGAAARRLARGVGRRRRARRGVTSTRPGHRRPARATTCCGPTSTAPRLPGHPAGPARRRARQLRRTAWRRTDALALDWQAAASLLLAAYGSLMLGDTRRRRARATEAVGSSTASGTPGGWCTPRRCSAGSPRRSTASTTPSTPCSGAATGVAAARLPRAGGAPPRDAGPRAAAGRDARGAAASSSGPSMPPTASGDGRLAATARLTSPGCCRSTGEGDAAIALLRENERWYAGAGGGDGALLTRCLLAAETDDQELARGGPDPRPGRGEPYGHHPCS